MLKLTDHQKKILLQCYELFGHYEQERHEWLSRVEGLMETETGIEGIEFFFVDGEFAGIGTPHEPKKMKLITREQLESGKIE